MTEFLQIFTTVDDETKARELAGALVEARLAACAQVLGPMHSTYWWQGQVERAQEWLILFKSRADLYPELEARLRELHPYDTPEILAVPVAAGLEAYLAWLNRELRHPAPPRA